MDIFIPIALVVIFCILLSVCGWCCKRHREGTVYGYGGTPVNVTSQHVNASPVVVPPYPIEARHPTPQVAPLAPGPGFAPPPAGYQTGGYPPTMAPGFYCPPGMGMNMGGPYPGASPYPPVNVAPYPPGTPYPPQTAPPPSYSEAVAHPPQPQAPTTEIYAKQAPYNPHY